MRVVHAACRDDFFMKTQNQINSLSLWSAPQTRDPLHEPLITGEQVAVALNLPLYYFNDRRKRADMGIPYYCINRMVRYRIREVHKWQVEYTAKRGAHVETHFQTPAKQLVGGVHA